MDKSDEKVEWEVSAWLVGLPEPKYLDKKHFLDLAKWKSPRPYRYYEQNDDAVVKETTGLAYQVSNEHVKLVILTVLKGVGVPVASAILHSLHPDTFPFFDVRAQKTPQECGL